MTQVSIPVFAILDEADVEEYVQLGCPLAQYIVNYVIGEKDLKGMGITHMIVVATPTVQDGSSRRGLHVMALQVVGVTSEGKLERDIGELPVEVFAMEGNPAASFVPGRPIDTNMSSAVNLDHASRWLRACMQGEHENCSPDHEIPRPTGRPSRLLKVHNTGTGTEKGDAIQLIICSQDQNYQYAALSYCWGIQNTFVTTTTSLQYMLQSIPLSALPPTIRDAVCVTRSMGLDYLWVDALCIIQDSKPDKLQEILKMAQIYECAAVVIGADRAAGCHEGFLGDVRMDQGLLETSSNEIAYHTPTGEVGSVKLRKLHMAPPGSESSQPIQSRAWTYQEAFFARRMLSFGDQLSWCCGSGQDLMFGVNSDATKRSRYGPLQKRKANDLDDLSDFLTLMPLMALARFFVEACRQRMLNMLQTSDRADIKSRPDTEKLRHEIFDGNFIATVFEKPEKECHVLLHKMAGRLESELRKKDYPRLASAVQRISEHPEDIVKLFRDFGMKVWESNAPIPPDFLLSFDDLIIKLYDKVFALLPLLPENQPPRESKTIDEPKLGRDAQPLETQWLSVVEQYSSRKLTYPRDRFPALSGVASKFAQQRGDSYLAGLWERDIFQGLLWHCASFNEADSHPSSSKSPTDYIAPSWSWASYPHGVAYPRNYRYVPSRAKLIGHDITLVEEANTFGEVARGSIKLQAPMQKVNKKQLKRYSSNSSMELYTDAGRAFSNSGKSTFWLMELSYNSGAMEDKSAGLVVSEVESNVFERVGMYRGKEDTMEDMCLCLSFDVVGMFLARRREWRRDFKMRTVSLV